MQVFTIVPLAPYTYGIALVAARDSEEAIKTYCSTEFREDSYIVYSCVCNIIVGLDYNTDKPVLILDNITAS